MQLKLKHQTTVLFILATCGVHRATDVLQLTWLKRDIDRSQLVMIRPASSRKLCCAFLLVSLTSGLAIHLA
jgi:hypothetical protein